MFESLFKKELIVGKDIKLEDINEFYWTYSTSTFPPKYKRYYFYIKNNKYYFYYEKREGEAFPLSEKYITESKTIELTNQEWKNFYKYIEKGRVKKREEKLTSGDSGPWTYLYWKNDKKIYQEYYFETQEKKKSFEDFCITLLNKR